MDAGTSDSNRGTSPDNRIKLNVGGKIFETTIYTIRSGGPDSLLTALSFRDTGDTEPVFIDRDPEIFSALLSLLRTNQLPSTARRFSKQELADEALYYGIEARLRSSMAPPPLDGIDASITATICPASEGLSSTFTAAEVDGSIWVAHGGQMTCYDWNLSYSCTVRTHLDKIDSICRVWPEIAAIGSKSNAGLHFYDFSDGHKVGTVQWTDPSDPRIFKARVNTIAGSESSIFAAFDCPHRENCILEVDKTKLQIVSQLARQSGNQAKHTAPEKLTWVPKTGVLVGSAVTSGAFGYSGYIRLWDPRSGEVVWETNEPGAGRSSRFGDSFACLGVDVEGLALFKLCSQSGDLAMADMRHLGEDPWIYLQEKNPSLVNTGGVTSSAIHCYRRQVFVGREGDLEVWSRLEGMRNGAQIAGGDAEGLYRRNFVDKIENSERGIIKQIEGGGNRLFISREDVEGIEVWESSPSSGAISAV
ncbi:protein ENDOPLASMIC RETICULUM-ARRESTED PEN3 [Prosopis cineraria]|uniref:protein ENDOPLASMIC RETICULUM-ARRESTED PEN3 n=1 Tax=Prosopis cineraria TaxID=364024 RepID=UPI00240F3C92|nr:protein ENDOPLASMIC RETICULUM-ARRESTED PEN3 [Prosopis cineraria]XP_054806794.1 protein ENDOPLASMIC RETICULUM-ARRESTED PEN3 [Prosopis cineraria]XP_054806795.1 protein ENDOPLASMIC RETICULUM-ARRESTED PEN3 [Prosopis cineraria]